MSDPAGDMREEVVAALDREGFEIVQERFGPGRLILLTLDREGGIAIDECVRAHKMVRGLIVEAGMDPGDFRIEVESPGADRPLQTPRDFERFRGHVVRVRLNEARVDGRKTLVGKLEFADEHEVRLQHEDLGPVDVDRSTIEIVRLEP